MQASETINHSQKGVGVGGRAELSHLKACPQGPPSGPATSQKEHHRWIPVFKHMSLWGPLQIQTTRMWCLEENDRDSGGQRPGSPASHLGGLQLSHDRGGISEAAFSMKSEETSQLVLAPGAETESLVEEEQYEQDTDILPSCTINRC